MGARDQGPLPTWLPALSGNWKNATAVRTAAGRLKVSEKLDFQRACTPYLQLIFNGGVTEAPEMKSLDAAGVDHVIWHDEARLRAAIQCKGFSVTDQEMGKNQAAQCVKSISSFRSSGLQAEAYIILHNRENAPEEFRAPVLRALAELRASGAATYTALWTRHDLLRTACESLVPRIESAWRTRGLTLGKRASGLLGAITIKEVPVSSGSYRFSAAGLVGDIDHDDVQLLDPIDLLAKGLEKGSGLRFLLGGFGYGKTTAGLRLAEKLGRRAIYLPASLLRADRSGGRSLFWQAVESETLRGHIPNADFEAIEPLAGLVAERLLRTPRSDVMLIIDGLDEAPLAHRPNGLALILNTLADSTTPTLLTMRSEFWLTRQAELAGALKQVNRPSRPLIASQLQPWDDAQIRLLVQRTAEGDVDSPSSSHLQELSRVIGDETYTILYGDIPRRPLFLHMLIDDVRHNGLQERSAVDLVDSWIRRKLERDWLNPQSADPGGGHRPQMDSQGRSVDTLAEMAWSVMDRAAGLTLAYTDEGSERVLAPDLSWSALIKTAPELGATPDLSALCLSTLLIPTAPARAGRPVSLSFAHRAFQEFFAARYVLLHAEDGTDQRPLPPAVADWVGRMRDKRYP